MNPEESGTRTRPNANDKPETQDADSPLSDPAHTPETNTTSLSDQPVDENTGPNGASKPLARKPVSAAKSSGQARPEAVRKAIPDKPALTEPRRSLPLSMIFRPDRDSAVTNPSLSHGELEESFEDALARVKPAHYRNSSAQRILRRIWRLIRSGGRQRSESFDFRRRVAFDGFRSDVFEEKRERDRRYGTVYTVSEEANAFLVRLELPRLMSKSSLKQTWELPDEVPDYACSIALTDNVLIIRAGLPDEARRRLSYVSPSFPSDFQTRIDLPVPVGSYKHQVRNKALEVVVFKKSSDEPTTDSRRRLL